jgi:hypothetical protein
MLRKGNQVTTTTPAPKTWLWITAAPLLLMLLLIIAGMVNLPIPFLSQAWVTVLALSVLVGLIALIALIVLRVKQRITFSQPAMWLSIVLACLDIVIPVALVSFLFYALRSLHF